jgi:hypothetical protein
MVWARMMKPDTRPPATGLAAMQRLRMVWPDEYDWVQRELRSLRRGGDALAPGERFCGIGGMAAGAVARIGQRLAARDVLGARRFALGLGMAFGNGERSAQKNASENRPHRPAWSLHHLASRGVIARKPTGEGCHAVSRRGSRTTQTEKLCRHSRHEIAIFESAASGARFVVRGQENPT